ncbi:MAG: XRE family transcriptional regulator [Spirochaetes bacterium]|nr:MAG: XRE family transcriptional regulator [Spirochaetota bacterium]
MCQTCKEYRITLRDSARTAGSFDTLTLVAMRVRARMEELGLSVTMLTQVSGVSQGWLSRILSTRGSPKEMPLSLFVSLAVLLKTTPNYLLGWPESEPLKSGPAPAKGADTGVLDAGGVRL